MPQEIFAKSALDKLSSPEQLDQLIRITPPRSWVSLAALGLVLLAIVLWGVFGAVSKSVLGQGIITRAGGISKVVSNGSGVIGFSKQLRVGDLVREGQILAVIDQPILKRQIALAEEHLRDMRVNLDEVKALQLTGINEEVAAFNTDLELEYQAIAAKQEQLQSLERIYESQKQSLVNGYISRQEHENTKQSILSARLDILRARELANRARVDKDRQMSSMTSQLQVTEQQVKQAEFQLKELEDKLGHASNVVSTVEGRIVEILASNGDAVQAGESLVSIARDDDNLVAIIYLPHTSLAKRVAVGSTAQISPVAYNKARFGYLKGKVTYVSPYPISEASMLHVLGSEDLAGDIARQGAPVEVRIELLTDSETTSGYRWSSEMGSQIELTAGSWCFGSIQVEENRPISMVFPLLKSAAGI
ncbi:NHLP bacteriocin system secretion protein [Congregibacter variabilis]|uniref:NHLP bacteriocin system secretion protein n=1 Tax=Congregibacter variabilis TaxID=3081200 RepID=A0ABZ0I2T2_9GAMM|nr:NHLP bacteriocin system secretion protein [Congregibacter sp. IMCC43200]